MGLVSVAEKGKTATITIDNPPMNVLSPDVLRELKDSIGHLEKTKAKAVILRGEGKTFCAGANIKDMEGFDKKKALEFGELGQRVMSSIEKSPKIYIAAIHGHAFGGGCELALACDFRVAEKSSMIAQPEIKIGIITGFGGTQRLPLIVGLGRAKDLLLTGRALSGEQAYRIGLVDRLAEDGRAKDEAEKLAGEIAELPGIALRTTKEMTDSFMRQDFKRELRMFAECFQTGDQKEGMKAFLEKRKPEFRDA